MRLSLLKKPTPMSTLSPCLQVSFQPDKLNIFHGEFTNIIFKPGRNKNLKIVRFVARMNENNMLTSTKNERRRGLIR